MKMGGESLCYNKGCGGKFLPEENTDGCCSYHPGSPVFHDAYKGWSCCNKRSTDFTTFLNLPGCTKGKHNPEKPPEVVKHKPEPLKKDEIIVVGPPPAPPVERGDIHAPLSKVEFTLSQSLKNSLNAKKETQQPEEVQEVLGGIAIGESCKNSGCKATFDGSVNSEADNCQHHPGYPVFHEGMKYWSCCKKKTTDFNSFLDQHGCTSGSHVWIKKNVTKTNCRHDWHQTAQHSVMTIYAKNPDPEHSRVEMNSIRLRLNLTFEGSNSFEIDSELFGVVDVPKCVVTMYPTKVELKLWKRESFPWKTLFLERPQMKKEEDKKQENMDSDLNVDAIDLSEL